MLFVAYLLQPTHNGFNIILFRKCMFVFFSLMQHFLFNKLQINNTLGWPYLIFSPTLVILVCLSESVFWYDEICSNLLTKWLIFEIIIMSCFMRKTFLCLCEHLMCRSSVLSDQRLSCFLPRCYEKTICQFQKFEDSNKLAAQHS